MTTPLRDLFAPGEGNLAAQARGDDSEQIDLMNAVLEAVQTATDLSSLSDELREHIRDPITERHLSPHRANILRALALAPEMTVLEIGAECAALGRYLGETCAVVDLVEPSQAKASVASARVAELPNVRVFQGTLDLVPSIPTYDVIVCADGLSRVGDGSASSAPYVELLAQCEQRLKPGGTLVFGMENALGVKYLAGIADDHTGRPFDGPENYLLATPARTFSRAQLESLAIQAGLTPFTLAAMPDHKMTSTVIAREAFVATPHLARDIHRLPSRDYVGSRIEGPDERQLWKHLADAGIGFEFANSYILLAGKESVNSLWNPNQLAVRFTTDRRRAFATAMRVESGREGISATRALIDPVGAVDPDASGGLTWRPTTEPVFHGPLLSDLILESSDPGPLLASWAAMVRASPQGAIDLQPWNIVVTPHGLEVIDQEWHLSSVGHEETVARGLLLLANEFSTSRRFEGERAHMTCLDVIREWAQMIDVGMDSGALQQAIDLQARIGSTVHGLELATARELLASQVGRTLGSLRPPRVDQHLRRVESDLHELRALVAPRAVRAAIVAEHLRNSHTPWWRRALSRLRHTAWGESLASHTAVRRAIDSRRSSEP